MYILNLLAKANALHKNKHFVYSSGEHGDAYINLRILKEPEHESVLKKLSFELLLHTAQKCRLKDGEPVVVVGPDTLGAIIAQTAVAEFNKMFATDFRYLRLCATTHSDGQKTYGWGMRDPVPPEDNVRVMYLDDLMNAGSTFERCRPLIEAYGKIAAVGVIADRSGMDAEALRVPHFVSLVQMKLERYPEKDCPHCQKKVPIVTNLGHGLNFKRQHPDYGGGYKEI